MLTVLKWILVGFGAVLGIYLLILLLCALMTDPRKQYDRENRFYRFVLDFTTAVVLKLLRVRVHVSGTEKLPTDQKILFVGNHLSNFDPIVTWYAFRKWHIAFLSKKENFKIPLFGRIIRKCCFMPIDRQDPRKALSTVNAAAKLLRRQEVSVGVYPEGTRSKSGELLGFHSGVFKIATKAEVPTAVVHVHGTTQIRKNLFRRPTDVYLTVLEVFPMQAAAGSHLLSAATEQLLRKAQEEQHQGRSML